MNSSIPQSGAESTRQALLLAALSLFAANGISATSINRITQRAGCRNSSALHYHFGSKDGLLDQLLGFIQSWFDEHRAEALMEMEHRLERGGHIRVEEVLRIFVAPYVEVIGREEWGFDAVRLLSHLELEQEQSAWETLQRWSTLTAERFLKLLSAASDAEPSSDYPLRLLFFIDSIIHGFASHRHLKASFLDDLQPPRIRELGDFYVQCGVRLLGRGRTGAGTQQGAGQE